jgi:hypothetical protein
MRFELILRIAGRNFHLPEGTALVTMHASQILILAVTFWN